MMRERALLFGLPTLSGLSIAWVLLGPGALRPVVAARAYGLPVVSAERVAVRVQIVRRFRDLEEGVAGPVEVEWSDERGIIGRATSVATDEGWADANGILSTPIPTRATLTVLRGSDVLARAEIVARAPLAVRPARACSPMAADGSLEWCMPRGVAVPEHPETIVIQRRVPDAEGVLHAELAVDAAGADVRPLTVPAAPTCDGTHCVETWTMAVTARAPTVQLDVSIKEGDRRSEHHAELPLQTGGIWLDPEWRTQGRLRFRSSTPRRTAYVSIEGEQGRLWGGVVPLEVEPNGMAVGDISVTSLPALDAGALTAVVASDPREPRGRTVAWPLGVALRVEDASIEALADGVPAAVAAEESRVRAIRWPVAGGIVASALAVLTTLGLRVRRARQRLERHLSGRGESPVPARTPLGLGVAVLAAIAVAFAILALVVAYG